MHYLKDNLLIDVYLKAIFLECDDDFIKMLEDEIYKRGISLENWFRDKD